MIRIKKLAGQAYVPYQAYVIFRAKDTCFLGPFRSGEKVEDITPGLSHSFR